MAEKNFRVGVLQFAVSPNPADNDKKTHHWVEQAAKAGAMFGELERAVQAGDVAKGTTIFNTLKADFASTGYTAQAALMAAKLQLDKGKGDGSPQTVMRMAKIKFWDKNSALEKLFKHMGLFEADNRQKNPFFGDLANLPLPLVQLIQQRLIVAIGRDGLDLHLFQPVQVADRADELLVSPGVDESVKGDAQAVQAEGQVLPLDDVSHHGPGHGAARPAHQPLMELVFG